MNINASVKLCSLLDLWDSLVVTVGSNTNTSKFDEIVSFLLSKEMRQKIMESHNGDGLSIRG